VVIQSNIVDRQSNNVTLVAQVNKQ